MKIPPHLVGLSKRDIIRRNILLESRIDELEKQVEDLKRHLLAYENAHTPPSQKRNYPKREKKEGAKLGTPKGHKGVTRQTPEPTEFKSLSLDCCPHCQNHLGKPKRIEKRIIEEIPDPQPLRIIEFSIPHYYCSYCNTEVIATDSELPKVGNLGNNLQAQIALMRYEDRLPHRKIANTLNRQYGLLLTPATIFDVTRRVCDQLLEIYNNFKQEMRNASQLNADETGAKVNGLKHWFWVFMSLTTVLFCLRKKRDYKVIIEVLGNDYGGILTCDGLKQYAKVIKRIQRCWAHLIREAKFFAQKYEGQARVLYNSLCELFVKIKSVNVETTIEVRNKIFNDCIRDMQSYINTARSYKELKKFAVTIENGLHQWFTCILYPEIEPTNNRAERELREFVVQRKIFGSLRSEKGMIITETIMSVLATWKIRNLNTYSMLRATLSS
ncbi:MAG: IS66 family transposase [Nanoarchaeota archaeon]|nr:IS66 family transposase [Nanoarchaeota archaeon]MBU4352649.1 IS66 family transposase [Nanoarchaeota archaeon]MBU4456311.1 IS66 family transposase [Nanoarchaeota archaeon]MCG2719475.1 IS66 family transposase [Nanoarchaeota archaeon]